MNAFEQICYFDAFKYEHKYSVCFKLIEICKNTRESLKSSMGTLHKSMKIVFRPRVYIIFQNITYDFHVWRASDHVQIPLCINCRNFVNLNLKIARILAKFRRNHGFEPFCYFDAFKTKFAQRNDIENQDRLSSHIRQNVCQNVYQNVCQNVV